MVMGSTNVVLISLVMKASFEPKDGKANEVAKENNPKGNASDCRDNVDEEEDNDIRSMKLNYIDIS